MHPRLIWMRPDFVLLRAALHSALFRIRTLGDILYLAQPWQGRRGGSLSWRGGLAKVGAVGSRQSPTEASYKPAEINKYNTCHIACAVAHDIGLSFQAGMIEGGSGGFAFAG